ncbi:MAG: DUF1049 domain-containing protein [Sphaerospermopsis sp. SIO1G2]|nr:DUF1049 domain-containing protein [Sphaerospermopsis sp. SIO1G1]NET72438.1 DUF1049 domain-containing protein [Sphaerospermopsis sp. SIO1G2]
MTPDSLIFISKIMKNFVNIFISIIIAVWVLAIALISVQNATLVSVKFLVFQSIQVPFGLMLAFWVAVGLVGGAILLSVFSWGEGKFEGEEEAEFFVDDEDF